MIVLTSQAMRQADAQAMQSMGQSQLMANAGERIAEFLLQKHYKHIVAFAGPGNNGGDAIAAHAAWKPHAAPGATFSIFRGESLPRTIDVARTAISQADCVIDALLGTGARLPPGEEFCAAIAAMNEHRNVVAIDIPTGLDANSGTPSQPAVCAAKTITLGALKPGLLLETARDFVGELYLADIGISKEVLAQFGGEFGALDDDGFAALLPRRSGTADKRSAGAPLIIAGSRQFPGAAFLCAMGAARAGAGYVTVATSPSAAASVRTHLIEQVVAEIPDGSVDDAVEMLLDTARHASAIGLGPGLGLDERTGEIIRQFLKTTTLPFVADAGALFHFSKHLDVLNTPRAVITPHAGEFARLSGKGTIKEGERVERLREFVHRTGCTTLLKGAATLIYDGKTMHINTTGTPALATAGTGDVLTGMIATLLSQGLSPFDAARVGAYWHGKAAQLAQAERPVGVIARDVIDHLAAVVTPGYAAGPPHLKRIF